MNKYSLKLVFADGSQLFADLDNYLPSIKRWLKEHGTPTNVDIVYTDEPIPNSFQDEV